MTKFEETDAGEAFISPGDSRETSREIMEAIAFRYIAFCMVTQEPLARAETAAQALTRACSFNELPDADYIEVLDCGENGRKIWTGGVFPTNPIPLYKSRRMHRTVFRGAGYAESHNPWPAVDLVEG